MLPVPLRMSALHLYSRINALVSIIKLITMRDTQEAANTVFQRGRCQIPLPIRCRPGFGAPNSAAGQFGKIVLRTMMHHAFLTLKGGFLAVDKVFFPADRGSGGGASDDPTSPHRRGVTTNVDWDGGSGTGTTSPRRQASRSLD